MVGGGVRGLVLVDMSSIAPGLAREIGGPATIAFAPLRPVDTMRLQRRDEGGGLWGPHKVRRSTLGSNRLNAGT